MAQPLIAQVVAALPAARSVTDRGHPWLRLDGDGGVHLLSRNLATAQAELVHLDPLGTPRGVTTLPADLDPSAPTGLLDLACDPSGTSLLLATDPDQGSRTLTSLGADGSPTWTRAAPFASAERLLYRGGTVGYVADGQGRVGEIDVTTGDLRQVIAWRDGAGRVFAGGGLLFFVYLDVRTDHGAVSAIGALGEPGWSLDGRAELDPWLRHPIGADAKGQLYVFRDGIVARLAVDGVPDVVGAMPVEQTIPAMADGVQCGQWQVDADGSIVLVTAVDDTVVVLRVG